VIFVHLQSDRFRCEVPNSRCRLRDTLPLVGFTSWCAPPPTSSLASTPGGVAVTVGPLVATPAGSFRPRGFSPPRRFAPRSSSRACCIPVPEGVRSVSRLATTAPEVRRPSGPVRRGLPRLRLHTPRRSPPSSSRTTSPWPLPPRRWTSAPHRCRCCAATLDLEALLRCRVRCDRRRCQLRSPSPSMGFVPLQGADRGRPPTRRVSASARTTWHRRPTTVSPPRPAACLVRATDRRCYRRCRPRHPFHRFRLRCCQRGPPARSLSEAARSRSVRCAASRSSWRTGPRPRTLMGLLTSKNVGTALRRGPNQPLGRFTGLPGRSDTARLP
jgi:hypothetical protein